ncbi:hypothetical protein H4582DRAFT_2037556, partial [Lactarius indigo]
MASHPAIDLNTPLPSHTHTHTLPLRSLVLSFVISYQMTTATRIRLANGPLATHRHAARPHAPCRFCPSTPCLRRIAHITYPLRMSSSLHYLDHAAPLSLYTCALSMPSASVSLSLCSTLVPRHLSRHGGNDHRPPAFVVQSRRQTPSGARRLATRPRILTVVVRRASASTTATKQQQPRRVDDRAIWHDDDNHWHCNNHDIPTLHPRPPSVLAAPCPHSWAACLSPHISSLHFMLQAPSIATSSSHRPWIHPHHPSCSVQSSSLVSHTLPALHLRLILFGLGIKLSILSTL